MSDSDTSIINVDVKNVSVECDDDVKVGQWFWVKKSDLACVVHVGSNYVKLRYIGDNKPETRIHNDSFWKLCTLEKDPDKHINETIARLQLTAQEVIGKIQNLMVSLNVSNSPDETPSHAMVLHGSSGVDPDKYKKSLTIAYKDKLPSLYKELSNVNTKISHWLTAKLIPVDVQIESQSDVIKSMENRVHNLELYTGLKESCVQIKTGAPAGLKEKIHIFQRRHYMDEECIAGYKAGGIKIETLSQFDAWLSIKDNMDRILPYPKCIVAFRVRRNTREYQIRSINDFFYISNAIEQDKMTFIYIRNGDSLYRISSSIEFQESLFPNIGESYLGKKLYGKVFAGEVTGVVTELERGNDSFYRYVEFKPSSLYYDDILKFIQSEMADHNKLVILIQGILDRSEALHPHPSWNLWKPASFNEAMELIYDNQMVLYEGEKPDFLKYLAECNKTMKVGSVTIGQNWAWMAHEARKENQKHSYKSSYLELDFHQPYGDPGPGIVSRVVSYNPKKDIVGYSWDREKKNDPNKEIRAGFKCSTSKVLNVDAYKPGDIYKFFKDPRTRSEYMKWAKFLILAEEYHAGNLQVSKPSKATGPKTPSYSGRLKYAKRMAKKRLVNQYVRLRSDISTRGGSTYKKDSLWYVKYSEPKGLYIVSAKVDGTLNHAIAVSSMEPRDLYIDSAIKKPEVEEDIHNIDDDDSD